MTIEPCMTACSWCRMWTCPWSDPRRSAGSSRTSTRWPTDRTPCPAPRGPTSCPFLCLFASLKNNEEETTTVSSLSPSFFLLLYSSSLLTNESIEEKAVMVVCSAVHVWQLPLKMLITATELCVCVEQLLVRVAKIAEWCHKWKAPSELVACLSCHSVSQDTFFYPSWSRPPPPPLCTLLLLLHYYSSYNNTPPLCTYNMQLSSSSSSSLLRGFHLAETGWDWDRDWEGTDWLWLNWSGVSSTRERAREGESEQQTQ